MNYPRISIVTPSFNQAAFLEETIQSVVLQNYPNLEYIIIDGGSSDNSVEIIKKYEKYLSYWVSEPDKGLYDALDKGFQRSSGEVMGWINSDDLLHRNSLFVLSNIFINNSHINWIQGRPTMFSETGLTVDVLEPVYSKYHFYLREYLSGKVIQQESTYWRRSLWEKAGAHMITSYKYAGDFALWMTFFKHDLLHYTQALIGGYRVRASQLSRSFQAEYLQECSAIIDRVILSEEEVNVIKKIRLHRSALMNLRFFGPILRRYFKPVSLYQEPVRFNYERGKFLQE